MVGLAASIPIIASLLHAIAVGWAPLGDNAIVAVRALDVFSTDPPALGMPAGGASGVLHEQAFHLGPMLFWLNAVPARLPWSSAMPVTVGLANIASVLGVVCIACRRGGRVLMYVTAAAIAVMARSIPAEMLAAVWNPAAALLPFTALVFLCWSVACGDLRLLPLTVVAASFVMQCHLTYVVPTLALLTVAGFGLVLGGTALDHRTTRNWLIGSAILGVVCWARRCCNRRSIVLATSWC